VVIPASLEEHPRVVDLLGDKETLGRLRLVHEALGEAQDDRHYPRNARSGSVRVARHTGRKQAVNDTMAMTTNADPNASGTREFTL
jgi:hypothetical protein